MHCEKRFLTYVLLACAACAQLAPRANAQSGFLSGSATELGFTGSPIAQANLTTTGTMDWRHWGLNGSTTGDEKVTGGGKISPFSLVGTSSVSTYADNAVAFSWTDGTATASATSTQTGVFVGNNPSTGFSFNVVATTAPEVLYVYTGAYNTTLKFSATLSDGSASPYTSTVVTPTNVGIAELYTLNFYAPTPGATLNISILNGGPASQGNVTLQAAALASGSASAPEPASLLMLLFTIPVLMQSFIGRRETRSYLFPMLYSATGVTLTSGGFDA